MPLLERYNPEVTSALLRGARIAGDDFALINSQTMQLAGEISQKSAGLIIIDRKKLLELPLALKRNLLRRLIEELTGDLRDIELSHIDEMIKLLDKPAGRRLNLPRGLVFAIDYRKFVLGLKTACLSSEPPLAGEFPLDVSGETLIPGWRVAATVAARSVLKKETEEVRTMSSDLTACLDLERTGLSLVVRSRRRGDRFQPLGMKELKKLGEFMIDARVPRFLRQSIPIVCSPQHIVWVVGWRLDERVRVTDTTQQVLRLQFERRHTGKN
jgi:tRNA(Ile)-lysidine synthase